MVLLVTYESLLQPFAPCLKPSTSTILYQCKKLPQIQILKFIDSCLCFYRRTVLQMASVRKPDTFFTKMLHESLMIKSHSPSEEQREINVSCVVRLVSVEHWDGLQVSQTSDLFYRTVWPRLAFLLATTMLVLINSLTCCCLCFVAKTLQGFCISSIHNKRLWQNIFSSCL